MVEFRPFPGGQFRSDSLGPVEVVRQPDSRAGNGEGRQHQDVFDGQLVLADLLRSRLGHNARQYGLEKLLESGVSPQRQGPANPAADER